MATGFLERPGNLGYIGLGLEATKGTAAATTDYIQAYEETLAPNFNLQSMSPIFGNKFEVYKVLPGMIELTGDLTTVAEPNTGLKLHDMLLTRGSVNTVYVFTVTTANATIGATYTNNTQTFTVQATLTSGTTLICSGTGAPAASGTLTKASGTGDTTITFSSSITGGYYWPLSVSATNPKSYTVEVSYYDISIRYVGVEASKITPALDGNEWRFKTSVTALSYFAGAEILSITGSGPYTITFKNDFPRDPAPTANLIANDLIRVFKSDGSTIDCTIASIASSTAITTSTNVSSASAGDMVFLRPTSTPIFNHLPSFLASNTQWCLGSTAAAALAAPQTRVELASSWELDHNMNDDKGEKRFGSRYAASIIRTTANYGLTVKKYFQGDTDVKLFNSMGKNACVIRLFSYNAGNTYEMRLIFNNITTDSPIPQLKPKEPNYSTIKYYPAYDPTDGQGMSVGFINNLSSIT